ncbi:MAG: sigma-70 family RNA polymerase sigma factor [Lachnospiraceae bacterium]|nr:sigma-70 family RNA polymerase sigma factor [Lachnospiraceae bacterium]
MKKTDDELYSNFIAGETENFDELTIRYGDALVHYLNNILHNMEDAEDLMIEAFARIMVKKPAIKPGGFKAYLYKTAHNLAMNQIKFSVRHECFDISDMEEVLSNGTTTESEITDKERRNILNLCMERIDPELKEALYLVYFEGLSYKETASVMKKTVKRVDKLLQRAKVSLRAELSKEGMDNAY